MVFLSLYEIVSLVIMSVALGFIFSDLFSKYKIPSKDPLTIMRQSNKLNEMLFAIMIVAPAVVLHELGHKFVAMAFGQFAQFHVSLTGLAIGTGLKLIGFPFIIFVPGYVSISGQSLLGWQNSLIAFAGPGVNLLLWLVFWLIAKQAKEPQKKIIFLIMARINLFLFAFNMIPIPPFDGYQVFRGLFSFFG
jgi:Zn-dependent protease